MTQDCTVVPLSPLRKIIAGRMAESKRLIPHYRLGTDIELDALLAMREETNAARPSKVSINDCLVKACAAALMECPSLNAQLVDDAIHQYRDADICVVTAIDGGLSTPIVRCVNRKTIWDIAAEIKALTARAAKHQLKMSEIAGGTFSISNLGAYGIDEFDAIINPPQCAILAIGRASMRAVVSRDRELRVANVVRATLSVDHRAIDGATAATFMTTLRHVVEHPARLFSDSTC